MSKILEKSARYKSPLYEMTQTTPTCLWNDSATLSELSYSIEHGAVGATCNPVIVLEALKKEANLWNDRIRGLAKEFPTATEDEIGWKLVEEISATRAKLLVPAFEKHKGRNGRLSIQTDPHYYRNAAALVETGCAVQCACCEHESSRFRPRRPALRRLKRRRIAGSASTRLCRSACRKRSRLRRRWNGVCGGGKRKGSIFRRWALFAPSWPADWMTG